MSCRKAAMDYLARREHSRFELTRKLRGKGFELDEISTVLDQLQQEHLLDDVRFTQAYAQSRVNRGFGPVRINQELLERGIGNEMAEEILTHWSDSWCELAAKQQQKKFKQTAGDYQERTKQARFLQYRGFTTEQIWKVLGSVNTSLYKRLLTQLDGKMGPAVTI